jgi:hypothetical protein
LTFHSGLAFFATLCLLLLESGRSLGAATPSRCHALLNQFADETLGLPAPQGIPGLIRAYVRLLDLARIQSILTDEDFALMSQAGDPFSIPAPRNGMRSTLQQAIARVILQAESEHISTKEIQEEALHALRSRIRLAAAAMVTRRDHFERNRNSDPTVAAMFEHVVNFRVSSRGNVAIAEVANTSSSARIAVSQFASYVASTGKKMSDISFKVLHPNDVALSPHGTAIASCVKEKCELWDPKVGHPPSRSAQLSGFNAYDLVFSDDDSILAGSHAGSRRVFLWDHNHAKAPKIIRYPRVRGEKREIKGFLPDSRTAVVKAELEPNSQFPRTYLLYSLDIDSGFRRMELPREEHRIRALSRDFKYVFTGGDGEHLTLSRLDWTAHQSAPLVSVPWRRSVEIRFSTGWKHEWVVLYDPVNSALNLWDLSQGPPDNPLSEMTLTGQFTIPVLAISPDDRHLALGSSHGIIEILELPMLKSLGRYRALKNTIEHLAFSADGKHLFAYSPDQYAAVALDFQNLLTHALGSLD